MQVNEIHRCLFPQSRPPEGQKLVRKCTLDVVGISGNRTKTYYFNVEFIYIYGCLLLLAFHPKKCNVLLVSIFPSDTLFTSTFDNSWENWEKQLIKDNILYTLM